MDTLWDEKIDDESDKTYKFHDGHLEQHILRFQWFSSKETIQKATLIESDKHYPKSYQLFSQGVVYHPINCGEPWSS